MIDAVWQYAKDEAIPRWSRLLLNWHLWLAIAAGGAIYGWSEGTAFSKLKSERLRGRC